MEGFDGIYVLHDADIIFLPQYWAEIEEDGCIYPDRSIFDVFGSCKYIMIKTMLRFQALVFMLGFSAARPSPDEDLQACGAAFYSKSKVMNISQGITPNTLMDAVADLHSILASAAISYALF